MKKSKKNELRYNEDDERTLLEDILGFIKVFVVSAIVILLFVNFVAHPVRVDGRSMYPTLKDGEFGFTNVGGVLLNGVNEGYSRCNHGRKGTENTLGKTCNRITR